MINKKYILNALIIIFSGVIIFSFLIPIINVVWMLPGQDSFGNQIFTRQDNFYTVFSLISVFRGSGVELFPILYIISVIGYGILVVLRFFTSKITLSVLMVVLIYPLLVSVVCLIVEYSVYNWLILGSIIISLVLLGILRNENRRILE